MAKIETRKFDFDTKTRIDLTDIYTENKSRFDNIAQKTGNTYEIVYGCIK